MGGAIGQSFKLIETYASDMVLRFVHIVLPCRAAPQRIRCKWTLHWSCGNRSLAEGCQLM